MTLPADPDAASPELLGRLGHEALAAGDAEQAVAAFGRAILLAPSDAALHADIAAAYLALGRNGEALGHAERAVRLAPGLAVAQHNLGNARFAHGDAKGALAAFRAARAIDPDSPAHWTNFLFTQVFTDADGDALFAENRAWGARLERRLGEIARPRPADVDPERPLRLAYFLPELDTHVTPRFVAPLLAHHDHARFNVTIYGDRVDSGPRPAALDHPRVRWVATRGLDAAAVAERMRADRVDVLLHPCTFKARYREVLAHRAAPLQIAAVNVIATTGLIRTDAFIGDEVITPRAEAALFTETLVRLPVFNTYRIPPDAPEVAPLPAVRAGFVCFGSFNNPTKISERAIAVWAEILQRVPASRLLLKHRAFDAAGAQAAMRARFAGAGTDPDRIDFAGFTAAARDYLAAYGDVDIALDPMPFSGGTTSYEAIWMGVPVLTLTGGTLLARQSTSLMKALGHSEFAADDEAAYASRAVDLAADLGSLAALRLSLRTAARDSIFDAAGYTRALEAAIRDLWRDVCHGT